MRKDASAMPSLHDGIPVRDWFERNIQLTKGNYNYLKRLSIEAYCTVCMCAIVSTCEYVNMHRDECTCARNWVGDFVKGVGLERVMWVKACTRAHTHTHTRPPQLG